MALVSQCDLQILRRAALNPFVTQSALILGTAPQALLGTVELHEIHMRLFLQPVKGPLDDTEHITCTIQLGASCKLAADAFNPNIYVVDEDIT